MPTAYPRTALCRPLPSSASFEYRFPVFLSEPQNQGYTSARRRQRPDEYWGKEEKEDRKKNKIHILEKPEREQPNKRWLVFEDGMPGPAPSQAEINSKPRGNGLPYFMDYGHKYAKKFTEELRPKLSPEDQQWLDKTRVLLQRKMEDGLASGKMEEHDHKRFKEEAFDTHSDAYQEAGLGDLSWSEFIDIAKVTEGKDLLDRDAFPEAVEALESVIGHKAQKPAGRLAGLFPGTDDDWT